MNLRRLIRSSFPFASAILMSGGSVLILAGAAQAYECPVCSTQTIDQCTLSNPSCTSPQRCNLIPAVRVELAKCGCQ